MRRLRAVVTKSGEWFVARCLEVDVVSQGETREEALANLKEAVELYIESFGEGDLEETPAEAEVHTLEIAVGD